MRLRTIAGWLTVIFIVWWVIVDPHAAAMAAHNIAHGINRFFHGLSTFFASL